MEIKTYSSPAKSQVPDASHGDLTRRRHVLWGEACWIQAEQLCS